jgi:hypothetical protein
VACLSGLDLRGLKKVAIAAIKWCRYARSPTDRPIARATLPPLQITCRSSKDLSTRAVGLPEAHGLAHVLVPG